MHTRSKKFRHLLSFNAGDGLREKLVAVSYQLGYKGEYGPVVRQWMADAMERYLKGLTDSKRGEYDEILKNVQIMKAEVGQVDLGDVIAGQAEIK